MTIKVVKYTNSRKIKNNEVYFSTIAKNIPHEGWLNSDQYLPDDYELVQIKENFLDKPVCGWMQGNKWVGPRVRNINYKYWKFSRGDHE